MRLQKQITDFIYGTNRARRNYSLKNPDETVFAADACKAIRGSEEKDIERGVDWVKSKRAVIILSDKKISCGDWQIQLDEVEKATLVILSGLLGGGQVLKIGTKQKQNFQFGMQLSQEWNNQDVLPLTIEKGKIKYSWFSIITRLLVVAYLLYLLIR